MAFSRKHHNKRAKDGFFSADWLVQDARAILAPVSFGAGSALYLSGWEEPSLWAAAVLMPLALLLLLLSWRALPAITAAFTALRIIGMSASLLALGFAWMLLVTHFKATPKLWWPHYGEIRGEIRMIDRSSTEKPRLLIAPDYIEKSAGEALPRFIRISLHGRDPPPLLPGDRISISGFLDAPSGATEPGGFSFARFAWFRGIGAIGYSRNSPELLPAEAPMAFASRINRLRALFAQHLVERLGLRLGGFAAAITVGDRAALSGEDIRALRYSNLAHLLAISGLHMGLFAGAVFVCLNRIFTSLPFQKSFLNAKQWAALGAIFAAALYLTFSGFGVATIRAFLMMSLLFGAVYLNRPALSLRIVSLAAMIILVISPHSVLHVGFQMSFAATAALIAVFSFITNHALWHRPRRFLGLRQSMASLVISSLVAGAATAPLTAFHFNMLSGYGLWANLAAVPLMSFIVMPAFLVALILWPIGLEAPALWVMSQGIAMILRIAHYFGADDSMIWRVKSAPLLVLGLIALGAVLLIILSGRRKLGALPLLLSGLALWVASPRPLVLLDREARLIGVMGAKGRMLNKPKGQSFSAQSWLESDGDGASQASAFARAQAAMDDLQHFTPIDAPTVYYLNADDPGKARAVCADQALIFAPKITANMPILPGCWLFDGHDLRFEDARAFWWDGTRWHWRTSYQTEGRRLWMQRP